MRATQLPCSGLLFVTLLTLAGCPSNTGGICTVDSDCDGEVCARNDECLPRDQVRQVRIEWTVHGMPASDATCVNGPALEINFVGDTLDDSIGFAPVPCKAGQFSVDKLPSRFQEVDLGVENGSSKATAIDGDGHASVDLTSL